MTVYYNEFDPYAAQWLRNLIDAGEIARGVVDERSIVDVQPADLDGFSQCHFFAGIGGWALAARSAGWPDSRELWTGSCPCQPFSAAGKQAGMADDRHLWPELFRLINSCRPAAFMGEQVAAAVGRDWLCAVQKDLEPIGYEVGAVIVPASGVGALHRRDRLWFVADAKWNEQPRQEPRRGTTGRMGWVEQPVSWHTDWQGALSEFRTMAHGVPRSVGATDAARNAIVPAVAAEVIRSFMEAEAA